MDVLKDKSYKQYNRLSRYSLFPYYYNTNDNKYVYGTTAHLKKNTNYVTHIVKRGDSLDSIALYYYNNPTYFWIIADFNNIQDPLEDLVVGSEIYVPDMSSIDFDI